MFTVAQATRVDSQGVGDAGGGARGGARGTSRGAQAALGGVGGAGRTPGVGEGLAVLRPRRLHARVVGAAQRREGVVSKLRGPGGERI